MPNLPSKRYFEAAFPHSRYIELTMHELGHEYCKPKYTVRPFNKSNYLFHYVFSGKGRLITTDASNISKGYTVNPGEGFMIWPEQTITYIADKDNPWQYAWIKFDGLLARELVAKSGLDPNNPIYHASTPEGSSLLAQSITAIIGNAERPHLELIGRLYMFMSTLIETSYRNELTNGASQQDVHVQKAIAYIGQHYQTDITVQEIADYCNVHRSYLCRVFKAALDTTPQQFVISYRIKRACELLMTSQLPIAEISTQVGYPNSINFTRAFKREVGQSPQKWKKTAGRE